MTNRAGLRTWLGVSDGHISKWIVKGFPKSVRGKYDKMKIALWLDMTPEISKAVKIIARKFIAERQAKKPEPTPKAKPSKITLGKKGIKEAVERARLEEVKAHARYEVSRATNSPLASNLLEEWRDSCDFLSKAEPTLLKFLKDCGEVAPVEEFQKFMAKKVQTLKSAFLNLPSKLAPDLEGKEWPAIQKILETELEGAFDKLSK